MAIKAGEAMVKIYADSRALTRGLNKAQRKMRAFGASVSEMGGKLMRFSAIAALPFALAARTFAGFEDKMAEVKAVTGAVGAEFNALTEEAKRLGRTTSFTARQVAEGMTELGRAGFKANQILASTNHVLNLARGTSTELGLAATIAAASMRGFGLEAKDTEMIVDVLTATANNSSQNLEDLGESMKYVAPLAMEAGEDIKDVAAALGVLANNGIKGSMAGTALARAFKNLTKEATQTKLDEIGVDAIDSAGNLRKVADIIQDIGEATAEMGTAQKLGVFDALFGRGQAAALKLATAEGFGNMRDALTDIQGTAKKTAETMDDTLGGSFRMFMSAAEGVLLAVGSAFKDTLDGWTKSLTKLAGKVTEWVRKNKDMIVTAGKTIVIVGAIGAGLVALGSTINFAAFAVGGLSKAISFLAAHPMVLAVAAAAGLGIAIGKLIEQLLDYQEAIDNTKKASESFVETDLGRLAAWDKLSKKGPLSGREMDEAESMIEQMTVAYGDLGLSIDRATGKIHGLAIAQARLKAIQELDEQGRFGSGVAREGAAGAQEAHDKKVEAAAAAKAAAVKKAAGDKAYQFLWGEVKSAGADLWGTMKDAGKELGAATKGAFAGILDTPEGWADKTQDKVSKTLGSEVSGTFSAVATFGMGAGDTAAERTAIATEETAKAAKETATNTKKDRTF